MTWIDRNPPPCRGWEWDVPETVTPYCPNCGANMEDSDAEAQ